MDDIKIYLYTIYYCCMLDKISNFIKTNALFTQNDKILVGVSGGMDSILLITLLQRLNYNFGIAHCNFSLRAEESDKDELFVNNLAVSMNIPYHSIQFKTKNIAKERKTSIQIVARDLRYEWFAKIKEQFGYQYIATGHHINDSIETVFYNIAKGCGIRGLHGIASKSDKIIRPLMCFTRQEIVDFIQQEKIEYREDLSNSSIKYRRNFIRHEILPKFREINPNFDQTSLSFIDRMKETEELMLYAVESIKKDIQFENINQIEMNLEKLAQYPAPKTILFELLRNFEFNSSQIEQILEKRKENSGKKFISSNETEAILDRNKLLIKKNKQQFTDLKITSLGSTLLGNRLLIIENIEQPVLFNTDSDTIYIDESKISFPLIVRKWKNGDRFQPFGMHGKSQKLQDYFTNQKLNLFEKDNIKIIESNGQILWIIGYRMADWAKITAKTKSVLKISISSNI